MAANFTRDDGPMPSVPPRSTGNAGGTRDAWESGNAQDMASTASLEDEANDSDDQ